LEVTIFEMIEELKGLAKQYGSRTEVKLYNGTVEIAELLGTKRDHDIPTIRVEASTLTGEVEIWIDTYKQYKELMH